MEASPNPVRPRYSIFVSITGVVVRELPDNVKTCFNCKWYGLKDNFKPCAAIFPFMVD
jgi:hypothetical protein